MPAPRFIFIGDVHGCIDELNELIDRVAPRHGDRFAFVGDIVDRGPDTPAVIRRVMGLQRDYPGSLCVAGNHEDKALRCRDNDVPPDETWDGSLCDNELAWLEGLPLFVRIPEVNVLLVHGGVYPWFYRQHPDGIDAVSHGSWRRSVKDKDRRQRLFLFTRRVDERGRFVPIKQEQPCDRFWARAYDGREGTVVYGHTPMQRVLWLEHSIGLDTGACFGGSLTAAITTTGRGWTFESVKARRPYAELWRPFEDV